MSNPTLFEDPRATAEIRPLFAYHVIDEGFVTDGGHAIIAAVQARVAFGDRFAIIATKDGYVWLRPNEVLPNKNGWANIALGAKYAVWRDPETRSIATLGLRYEIPSGSEDVLQGKADGVFNPFLSGGWSWGDLHLLGQAGARLPVSGADSSFFDLSLHADYRLGMFYPLLEWNWVHVLDGGRRLQIDQEGFDFFNLGARSAGGQDVITMATGLRIRPWDRIEWFGGRVGSIDFGGAYEFPISHEKDIFGGRWTADMVIRFW